MKIALAFIVGAGMAVALTIFFRPTSEPALMGPVRSEAIAEQDPGPAYQALLQYISELESQIAALEAQPQAINADTPRLIEAPPQTSTGTDGSNLSAGQRTVRRLIDGGFTAERAEWILNRYEDLVSALSLPDTLERDPLYLLRKEIGDAEFERYLRATGRDPVVFISGILAGSQAALYGFQRNDRITSFDGHRVFDHREVRLLDSEGVVGAPVIVDFIRDGQPMQIFIPRGSFDAFLFPTFVRLPEP